MPDGEFKRPAKWKLWVVAASAAAIWWLIWQRIENPNANTFAVASVLISVALVLAVWYLRSRKRP